MALYLVYWTNICLSYRSPATVKTEHGEAIPGGGLSFPQISHRIFFFLLICGGVPVPPSRTLPHPRVLGVHTPVYTSPIPLRKFYNFYSLET